MRLRGAFVFTVWPLHYNKSFMTKMYRSIVHLLVKIIFMDVMRVLQNIYGIHAYFKISHLRWHGYSFGKRDWYGWHHWFRIPSCFEFKVVCSYFMDSKRRQLWNVSFNLSKSIFTWEVQGALSMLYCYILLSP